MRKVLLFILFVVLVVYMLYKSPFSASYYYNKAKALYSAGQYEQSLPLFEKSLFSDPKNILTRFYYVLALSKSEPTYSVQKKLYEIGNSKINDEAKKYARYQAVYLRHNLLIGVENNYIFNAVAGNDIIRWDINSFPLKIYYKNVESVPAYYHENIDKALSQWTQRTNFVKFVRTKDEKDANIVIKFSDISENSCKRENCKFAIAYTDPVITSSGVLEKMNLTFFKTNPRHELFSPLEVYNTALHEIGHTLGLMGHSDNPEDLMYASNDNSKNIYALYRSDFQYLTSRDLKTLALLYRLEPTISNVKGLHSENFYYPPLIMGSEDARLFKKLEEYQKYIQKYPNFAAGYINIASIYVDMGDFDLALKALNSASNLAQNEDENYMVAYNRAIIYYNKRDYNNALNYAKQAKSIRPSNNIDELINDIDKIKNAS